MSEVGRLIMPGPRPEVESERPSRYCVCPPKRVAAVSAPSWGCDNRLERVYACLSEHELNSGQATEETDGVRRPGQWPNCAYCPNVKSATNTGKH
jgi:hypothetical protein